MRMVPGDRLLFMDISTRRFHGIGPVFTFVHSGSSMTASHEISVAGPHHLVDMTLRLTLTFDREERISSLHVEPSDPGLFTHVIAAAFSLA